MTTKYAFQRWDGQFVKFDTSFYFGTNVYSEIEQATLFDSTSEALVRMTKWSKEFQMEPRLGIRIVRVEITGAETPQQVIRAVGEDKPDNTQRMQYGFRGVNTGRLYQLGGNGYTTPAVYDDVPSLFDDEGQALNALRAIMEPVEHLRLCAVYDVQGPPQYIITELK